MPRWPQPCSSTPAVLVSAVQFQLCSRSWPRLLPASGLPPALAAGLLPVVVPTAWLHTRPEWPLAVSSGQHQQEKDGWAPQEGTGQPPHHSKVSCPRFLPADSHRGATSFSNWLSSVPILRARQRLVLPGMEEAAISSSQKNHLHDWLFSSSPKIYFKPPPSYFKPLHLCIVKHRISSPEISVFHNTQLWWFKIASTFTALKSHCHETNIARYFFCMHLKAQVYQ